MNCTFPQRDDYDENVDSSHPTWTRKGGNRGLAVKGSGTMALIVGGYRKLYGAPGCSIEEHDEISLDIPLQSGMRASIYFGPRPPHGFLESRATPFIAPSDDPIEMSHTELHRDPQKFPTKYRFFTEVLVVFDVDVEENLRRRFTESDTTAMNDVMARVQIRSDELLRAAEIASGILWLRLHRQFVFEQLCEHYVAFLSDTDYAFNVTSPWTEMLKVIRLRAPGIDGIKEMLPQTATLDLETQVWVRRLLGWLMSAWSQRDAIHQFVVLFIVFEVLLSNWDDEARETPVSFATKVWRWLTRRKRGTSQPEEVRDFEKIKDLIKRHGGIDKAALLQRFQSLLERSRRPPLNKRFETLARSLNFEGWENDVTAFKKLLKKRNNLLHRGEREVALSYTPSEGEIVVMRDLAARYVNARIFGDDLKGRWRLDTPTKQI